jgi:hypothetical protein
MAEHLLPRRSRLWAWTTQGLVPFRSAGAPGVAGVSILSV